MLVALQFVTFLACAIFAGAALYVTLVEHPARMRCETRIAATQWAPSYHRGALMQAPLAIVGLLGGIAVWSLGAPIYWLVAGLSVGAAVPFTLLVIMPTNRRLQEPERDLASAETRALLERWGRLHAARTVLGVIALVLLTLVARCIVIAALAGRLACASFSGGKDSCLALWRAQRGGPGRARRSSTCWKRLASAIARMACH